ncbi:MAG: hypothetical protein ACRDXX_03720 [Stackebrandtia sp.]
MSTSHLRLIAIVAVVAGAAFTGIVAGILAGDPTLTFAGFAGAALTGAAVLGVLGGRLKAPVVAAAAPHGGGADDSARAAIEQLRAERRSLVDTCIYVRDRATSQAIADKIGAGLGEVGVVTVAPVGERFDPTRHEAGGVTAAPDPARDGVIAVVETVGYADRQGVLRNPIVTVFRAGGGARS